MVVYEELPLNKDFGWGNIKQRERTMALKDLGYNHICSRCGTAADLRHVKLLKIDLGDGRLILRPLCWMCIDEFESMYREW